MRRETPLARKNPGGDRVWVARWTDKTGKRRYGWPPDIKGTHRLKRDAQAAIDACYERDEAGPLRADTLGGYFASWTQNHPRSKVTDRTNTGRINAVLDVEIERVPLRDWPFAQLRRRHASALVAHMLTVQGRAILGVRAVLQSLSAMTEDAIEDEVAVGNPFKGVKVRANDPRIQKASRQIRVWEWEQMHSFARACGVMPDREPGLPGPSGQASREYRAAVGEVMARLLTDCGLRIGELLALRRCDLDLDRGLLNVRQTLTEFGIEAGTKSDKLRGVTDADEIGRVVPLTPELCEMLKRMPKRSEPGDNVVDLARRRAGLLFPAPLGGVWWYGQWLRDVWQPAQKRTGIDMRPHEARHSFVSHMRAAGVNDDDLAAITGHTVLTMLRGYSHSLGRSFDVVRKAVGE